eukprot:COSAG05_NODE_6915_length_882_cov_0.715198_3_plen_70_part_01
MSGMSNTSSFHPSHMKMTGGSMVPPGGAVHDKPFRSYVQPDQQKVASGAQTKGWVQSRVRNKAIEELNEV